MSNATVETEPEEHEHDHDENEVVFIGVLDQPVTDGLRLWMILAIVLAILLTIMIVACCVLKIRIPRTKREIDYDADGTRSRRISHPVDLRNYEPPERGCKVMLMGTDQSSNHLLLPPGPDPESASCTTCATCDRSHTHTPTNGSRDSLNRQPPQQQLSSGETSAKYSAV